MFQIAYSVESIVGAKPFDTGEDPFAVVDQPPKV